MPKRSAKKEDDRLFIAGLAKKYQRERLGVNDKKQEIYEKILREDGKLLPGEHLVISNSGVTLNWTPEREYQIIINPEVDIRNEMVLQEIEALQREIIKEKNPPPQPQAENGSKKLDWRPVREWAMIHPHFSIKEIAHLLGRNYDQVKRALKNVYRVKME
ncbi:hypothetical protein FBQ81_12685 [Chloroflexi bacterium CFX6]|nr:hypothetical protein [Chloroflexi bacterium CFX6]